MPGWDQNDVYHDTQQVSGAAGTAGRGGESRPGGNSRQGSEQQPAVGTAGRGGEWRQQQAKVGKEGGWQAEDSCGITAELCLLWWCATMTLTAARLSASRASGVFTVMWLRCTQHQLIVLTRLQSESSQLHKGLFWGCSLTEVYVL